MIEGGMEERELCWYGDDELFVPHLWKVLGVAGFSARLRFGGAKMYPDRRVAAEQTHAEITTWAKLVRWLCDKSVREPVRRYAEDRLRRQRARCHQ